MHMQSVIFAAVILIFNLEESECMVLKQVVILSRHNVRTPLSDTLEQFSPKPWPRWNEKSGYLTAKGKLLEGYMGEYFAAWLNKKGILPDGCPPEDTFYVYSNTKQRTLESARSFVKNGFPNCKLIVHHAIGNDPIFDPNIHNTSSVFIKEALDMMYKHLKMLHLDKAYDVIENILDYKNSENCLKNKNCDLKTDVNTPSVEVRTKPNIVGPLKIGKSAIDSFLMENYEGFAKNHIAWGQLTDARWKIIMEISKRYHEIIFSLKPIAKDISKPLIKYLSKLFLKKSPKIVLIMGHDANIYTVLSALGFKPHKLENQYETIPIGGKVVFQKWTNGTNEFLKTDYVYQGTKQMRAGVRLSLDNPPIFKTLQLNGCTADANGFCLWKDFIKLLY